MMTERETKQNVAIWLIMLLLCVFLAGADTFTYSNPVVTLANQYYKNGDYKKAIATLRGGGGSVKDKRSLNFNLANAYYKANDFENALKHYEAALKADDDSFNAKIIFNMGNSYFKRGELEKAYEKFKASLKLAPEVRSAKYNLEYTLSLIDDSKKRQNKNERDDRRNAQKRDGELSGGGGNNDRNSEPPPMEKGGDINTSRNPEAENEPEDLSEEAARRILKPLTQRVIVRTPMREDPLTKKGGDNVKDW